MNILKIMINQAYHPMSIKINYLSLAALFFLFFNLQAQRDEVKISGQGWKIWLDKEAQWENDQLFLPGKYTISELPVNPPTIGWEKMVNEKGVDCSIPATVEEYFAFGNPLFTYHGVCWFWKEVDIPSAWQDKTVRIKFEETRLRAEVYINKELCAYDLVSETPWEADVSGFLNYGVKNIVAVRITNPGGHRGWEDFPAFHWGEYEFPSSHDFGGISGPVSLIATNDLYIDNVFVLNLPDLEQRRIEIGTSVVNKAAVKRKIGLTIAIEDLHTGEILFTTKYRAAVASATTGFSSVEVNVPKAKPWDLSNPHLYRCRVKLSGANAKDELVEKFGFRVFEVKEKNGQDNFYLNGRRIIHKSSIDWGYYAGTGLYATDSMAFKSVKAALDIGHNGINFHRCIGEPLVMDYADKMGLLIYEEPGGFHAGQQGNLVRENTFGGDYMLEKCRRMAVRDRNHPSLIIHNLCNEDNYWNPLREEAMRMINKLNPAVMVSNSSGGYIFDIFQSSPSNFINHIRPYEETIRDDFEDNHTVEESGGVFSESFLFSHIYQTKNLQYWGEVHCYGGPDNWYLTATELESMKNWDKNYFVPLHDKTNLYFKNSIQPQLTGNIKNPADISRQTGRGLMYINGRAVQNLMTSNKMDGFGINGWTGTSEVVPGEGGYWSSAILDEGRNLKGPAEDYAFWTRDLQIAIKRINGKFFEPGDVGLFDISLINHNILKKGSYILKISIRDGKGEPTAFEAELPVEVKGGDVFSQPIKIIPVKFRNWRGGYISIEGRLYSGTKEVAYGAEQVLLKNRASFNSSLNEFTASVFGWASAENALKEAKIPIQRFKDDLPPLSYICAGDLPPDEILDQMLHRVRDDGTSFLVRFDEPWANFLFRKGLISELPEFQPCKIEGSWMGNGWGYIDHYIGDQAIPGSSSIGTNSWEAGTLGKDSLQYGFWPLISNHPEVKVHAYGAHMARPDIMLVLLGELEYGKGKIILDAAYSIDNEHAFTDLLFYNLLGMGSRYKHLDATNTKTPFHINPAKIPGRIETEDYDNGGEGISFHDTDGLNQGNEYRNEGVDISSSGNFTFVGWIEKGEWLEYTVNIKEEGNYSLVFHYASPNMGVATVSVDGATKADRIQFPPTGDWFAFRMHETMVKLNTGIHTLRIYFNEGGINMDYMEFNFLE